MLNDDDPATENEPEIIEDDPGLAEDQASAIESEASEFRWDRDRLNEARIELEEWATKWGTKDDPYVDGLTGSLEDGSNMTMWASLDPYVRLPAPEIRKGRILASVASVLSITRNVLVFVPVAITWWAIGEATERFGEYNRSVLSPGDKTNFLDFWQDGYGRLDDVKLFGLLGVKIQEIALADSLIIIAVVALTLLASTIGQVGERRQDVTERRAEAGRSDLALALTKALEGKRTASPDSIAGSIATVLNDLTDAAHEVRTAAMQLDQASSEVGGFTSQISDLNTTLDQLSRQVSTQVSGDLVGAVEQLGRSVEALNAAVAGDTSRVMGDVVAGLDQIGNQLERTGASVEFGVKRLLDDLTQIHDRLSEQRRS